MSENVPCKVRKENVSQIKYILKSVVYVWFWLWTHSYSRNPEVYNGSGG